MRTTSRTKLRTRRFPKFHVPSRSPSLKSPQTEKRAATTPHPAARSGAACAAKDTRASSRKARGRTRDVPDAWGVQGASFERTPRAWRLCFSGRLPRRRWPPARRPPRTARSSPPGGGAPRATSRCRGEARSPRGGGRLSPWEAGGTPGSLKRRTRTSREKTSPRQLRPPPRARARGGRRRCSAPVSTTTWRTRATTTCAATSGTSGTRRTRIFFRIRTRPCATGSPSEPPETAGASASDRGAR